MSSCERCGEGYTLKHQNTSEDDDEVVEVYECVYGHRGRIYFEGNELIRRTGRLFTG